MSRIGITPERAKQLADEAAKRIYDAQEQARKDAAEVIKRALDPLDLDVKDNFLPQPPEIEQTEQEISEDLEYYLVNGDSRRYEVEEQDENDN